MKNIKYIFDKSAKKLYFCSKVQKGLAYCDLSKSCAFAGINGKIQFEPAISMDVSW
jgi:hypothetical protein